MSATDDIRNLSMENIALRAAIRDLIAAPHEDDDPHDWTAHQWHGLSLPIPLNPGVGCSWCDAVAAAQALL